MTISVTVDVSKLHPSVSVEEVLNGIRDRLCMGDTEIFPGAEITVYGAEMVEE